MKVLVADDSREKVARIIRALTDAKVVERDDISIASSAHAARTMLTTRAFDVLLLDIIFPRRDEDLQPDSSASLELLTELIETRNLVRPRHIVGITAFTDVADEVADSFRARTWTVLVSDELSDEWLAQIVSLVSYVREEVAQQLRAEYRTGVAIVTALRNPEMDAIRRLQWHWKPEAPFDSSSFYSEGQFECRGESVSVISAVAPRMGMVATSILATKIINHFRPRMLVMAGICAGVRGSVELGDVVFSSLSWDYQSGKHFLDAKKVPGFSIDPSPIAADPEISARVDQLATDTEFWVDVMRGGPISTSRVPRLLSGPLGSGSAVLADGQVTDKIRLQQRKLLGVDMEAYGLISAAESAGVPKPSAFAMKSVCDFADAEKSDHLQGYAAYVSARAIGGFLERYFRELAG